MIPNGSGLVVLLAAGMSISHPLAAQAVQGTAVAQSVYWGEPLASLLQGVGVLLQEGFSDREAKLVSDAALNLSPYASRDSAPRRSATFVHRVRFRNHLTRLKIRLVTVEIGYVDVHFEASDTGLIAAIRDVVWKAHLASLLPLERVRLDVRERLWTPLKPPKLVLTVETVNTYGCLGFGVDHRFSERGDTLDLELFGVFGPMGACPLAIGPAQMSRTLEISPGHYKLLVRYHASSGHFALDVTDSSTKVTPELASFVEADERLRWRFPPRSFALTCGTSRAVCDDVRRWLAHQPGISPLSFSPKGLDPYHPDAARDSRSEGVFFRYASDDALVPVRRCFAEIEDHIRETVGAAVEVRTWIGEQITAWSARSFDEPHIAVPERVTTGSQCSTGP